MQPGIREGDIPGVQLHHARRIGLAPEALWAWLTEPERITHWLSASCEPRSGGEAGWILRDLDEAGADLVEDLRLIANDGERLWVGRLERLDDGWESATKLTLRIQAAAGAEARSSDLSVLQQGFERLNLSRCLTIWELYRRRWRLAFDRLAQAVVEDRRAL